jgi:hypothetical protein
MPATSDFRSAGRFDLSRVDTSGRDVGRRVYWKLYAIENVMRVIIHSVLSAQVGADWWSLAVDASLQRKAQRFRATYTSSPWHSSPGKHDIYFVDLADLNEIMRANSNLFLPLIPDIDQWMARIEQIRLPRNIVAHMNWPSRIDRQRIDVFYSDVRSLATHLGGTLGLSVP